jgi:methylase of polypeptide subunit release factors
MPTLERRQVPRRYKVVSEQKANGATYTPSPLADFVAKHVAESADFDALGKPLHILDPAIGDGELVISLLQALEGLGVRDVCVYGFETDADALDRANRRIVSRFPEAAVTLLQEDFLSFVSKTYRDGTENGRFHQRGLQFDLAIANPPYVRTQVMGADQANQLASQFGLGGRVDLYHAFVVAIAVTLKPKGIAGIITSNRFMTTKSGASVRRALFELATLIHIWDLGDSKLFDAAVLPAVLLMEGKNGSQNTAARFTSIYETRSRATHRASNPIDALQYHGTVAVDDGRRFHVRHGTLNLTRAPNAVWAIANAETDAWLQAVSANTWGTFRTIGKVRVGIKTTADKVFIRKDWDEMDALTRPELLRPLVTHHAARRFRALDLRTKYQVLYPHVVVDDRRQAVDLSKFERTRRYFEQHKAALLERTYVTEAGRAWYEIWVPQDPRGWDAPKLVFRDISHEPVFWLDFDGHVVNGDCYWLSGAHGKDLDLLWLAAAVANSTFIEAYYDYRFHNKLYAGRRRFITQYVEQFPLPDPNSEIATTIVRLAKRIYQQLDKEDTTLQEKELDGLVWSAFGLAAKEVAR